MNSLRIAALATLLATTTVADDGSDYTLHTPMRSAASLNGELLVNETEILTPRGIVDSLPAPLTLSLQPPEPDTGISPAAGPQEAPIATSETTPE